MAQPGQATRFRQIRTLARNALLKVKIFLAQWEDLAKEGRGQLEAACNTITRATNWPLICTHSLKGCQTLQPSGMRALRRRYVVAKHDLNACMANLRTAVQDARNIVFTQLDIDTSEPLFSCVDGQQFFTMLQNIVEKHEQQLEVFASITQALPTAEDLLNRKSRAIKSWSLDQAHVIITTWLLQTKIDKDSVDSVMSLLNADVRTV